MGNYYTTSEAARLCQVSPGSVVRWIRDAKLKAAVTAGGHHRIHRKDLVQFMSSLGMAIPVELKTYDPARDAGHLRVLIVDDDASVRRMLRLFFEREYENASVEEAGDGFHAGWKAHEQCPDLVLLDLKLPGIDGFQVCAMIRKYPELYHTRVIAFTGQGEEHRERILKMGADDFLTKPFDFRELKEMIDDLIRKNQRRAA